MLLNWDQRDLARAAGVTTQTISSLETWKDEDSPKPNRETRTVIRTALESAGVELLDPIKGVRGPGAVLKWRDDMAEAPSADAVELGEDLDGENEGTR